MIKGIVNLLYRLLGLSDNDICAFNSRSHVESSLISLCVRLCLTVYARHCCCIAAKTFRKKLGKDHTPCHVSFQRRLMQ